MSGQGFTEDDQARVHDALSASSTSGRRGLGFERPKVEEKTRPPTCGSHSIEPSPSMEAPSQNPMKASAKHVEACQSQVCTIAGQAFEDKSSLWTYIKQMQETLEDEKVIYFNCCLIFLIQSMCRTYMGNFRTLPMSYFSAIHKGWH